MTQQNYQFNYLLDWTECISILDTVTRLYQFNVFNNGTLIGHIRIAQHEQDVTASLKSFNNSNKQLQRAFLEDLVCRIVAHDTKTTFYFDIDDKTTVDLLESNGFSSEIVIRG